MKKTIIAGFFIAIALAGCGIIKNEEANNTKEQSRALSQDEAKTKALDFINNNLLQAGTTADFKSITEEEGFYKIVLDVGETKDIESYITKDGAKFIPSMMDIEEIAEKNNQARAQQEAAANQPVEIPKNEKPEVELFVMSHCPYGTQIEKGMLPVLETLGDKIDFKLKFCDYAMHDKKELDEQLRQYCIQKNEPNKLTDYLICFLDAGESESCVSNVNITKSMLDSCVETADAEYKITENYNNKSTWKGQFPPFNIFKDDNIKYGIGGSPSLVVNGKTVSAQRDASSLLGLICSGFTTPPEECSIALSATAPSAGFGFGGEGSGSEGSCN
ncbi:MAG: hypothetical protein ABIC82_00490 [bacterium]